MPEDRVIDTFLFSEPHEADLLLAKLHVEEEFVTDWIGVENTFTTKGDPKDVWLEKVLDGDSRFARFRDRITVLSLSERFVEGYRPSPRDRVGRTIRRLAGSEAARGYEERPYFFAEISQRNAATAPMEDISGGKGWVIVSDVDEMVDGSIPERSDLLERAMSRSNIVHLPRRRFVYDFDNVSMAPFRYLPMARIEKLGGRKLGDLRLTPYGVPSGLEALAFEYSYCYDRASIDRKLETFTHADPGADIVARALNCNHATTSGTLLNHHWYETVGIDEAQHPAYIVDHLQELKTNVVNPDYRNARKQTYPDLFD